MLETPRIETATLADVPALAALRAEHGWWPSETLLAALADWDGGRIFIVRAAGAEAVVAATSAVAAGPTGVIGNVLVRPDFQRRGLARLMMRAALDWQRGRGVRSVVLDATVEGRPLYRQLGFAPMGAHSWYTWGAVADLDRGLLRARAGGRRAAPRPVSELARAAALDEAAFGGDRLGLLARVLTAPDHRLYLAEEAGAVSGYLIARTYAPPRAGVHLGPLVARTPAAGAALLAALLDSLLADDAPQRAAAGEGPAFAFRASLPGTSPEALALFGAAGARVEEDDLLMQLDFHDSDADIGAPADSPLRPVAAHPDWLYAWLASMVF